MIDFACKKFELLDVIKCGLGLTKSDFKVLTFLRKNSDEEITSEKLAQELNLNLSTVQRAVKKLHGKDVLIRTQKNLDGGGYLFYYQIRSKKEVRKIIMDIIKAWTENVESSLEMW